MDHARKWVLSPSESDNPQENFSEEDFNFVLKMFKKGLINDEGKLLSKTKGKFINDSSIYQNHMKKKKSRHFDRFLELKAQLTTEKPLKTQKRKKTKWDLDDD